MSAHRHWAMVCAARPASPQFAVARIQFRASLGGANLAVGGVASGPSSAGETPDRAFDGDNSTQWYVFAPVARAAYDFGSPVEVGAAWLRLPGAGTYNGDSFGPSLVYVQRSDDGQTWTTVRGFAVTSQLGNDAELEFEVSGAAQPIELLQPADAKLLLPAAPLTGRVLPGAQMLRRVDWGGAGRVRGTVKIKGTPDAPVRRVVRLVRELDAVCVAQVLSHPLTGEYEFSGFDPSQRYTVLAYDLPSGFRAAVASGVLPEPLPL